MKGPFHRLRYNLDRVWECQSCHHKCRTPGSVTVQMCGCKLDETGKMFTMRLVADGPRRVQFSFEVGENRSNQLNTNPQPTA